MSHGEGTPLYVDNGILYGEYPGIQPPHAFLDFPNLGLSCGTVGKVIFGYTNSNKCSVSGPFEFNHDEILYNPAGSFLVCGPNKDVSFHRFGDCHGVNVSFFWTGDPVLGESVYPY